MSIIQQTAETTTSFKITNTKAQSEYAELIKKVREEGLLNKTPSFYVKRFILFVAISAAVWTALVFISLSSNIFILALALPAMVLQGILAAQFGFIGHEAAHRQVFHSNKLNDYAGIVVANLFAGLSYGFWLRKHNKHHAKPNQIGEDPDIYLKILAFTPEDKDNKPKAERFLTKRQGYLFPFLLMLTAFDLLLDSFLSLGRKGHHPKRRFVEFGLMMVRTGLPIAFLFVFFNPIYAVVLWFAFMFAFGFFMGAAFAPNHKGMPLVPKDSKVSFFQRQVLTSRNIKSSWLKDNLMGGLNYQVEHHLFPSMPRPQLKRAHQLVMEHCKKYKVPFTEVGLFKSYKIVIQYLNKVGLSNNTDPFVCPMVAELRPRY